MTTEFRQDLMTEIKQDLQNHQTFIQITASVRMSSLKNKARSLEDTTETQKLIQENVTPKCYTPTPY